MGLTTGGGPHGESPHGHFDFEPPERVRYEEPSPRRVRGERDGRTVVDSRRAWLFWETGAQPRYAFPADDVSEGGAPLDGMQGYVTFRWDELDAWYEEEEQVHVHVRDPYHRIDVLETASVVRVSLDGVTLAEGTPRILFETGLPPRYYFDRSEVTLDRLRESSTSTGCPYKGAARYWSVEGREDVAWAYDEPRWDAERVRGRICFFNEKVELEVDGETQPPPTTQWS